MSAPISSPLLTDLYQLTMAQGYWSQGRAEDEAVFHLFFRSAPFDNGHAIAGGLETAVRFIESFAFSDDDITYLSTIPGNDGKALFSSEFLGALRELRFEGNVHAIPEGEVVYPNEPLLRIQAPLWIAQLLETPLLTTLNFQTLIATKASRICAAARGDAVLEFGLRRAQGFDGGLSASRAAYIGGCTGTSNVLAGRIYGIPVKGTHAHSWVMAFESEIESFEAYAESMPNNCVFLVDTYDTVEGVKNAIRVGDRLRQNGHKLVGIRLDSGDLAALSIAARKLLDAAGFEETSIVASNDLDEYSITKLKSSGAKIGVWGIGTKLVTSYDQPALGGVYKLGALRRKGETGWRFSVKLSEDAIKSSNPGILQVRRGEETDILWCLETGEPEESGNDLLVPIFIEGKRVYVFPEIDAIRDRTVANSANPIERTVELEPRLRELKETLISKRASRSPL